VVTLWSVPCSSGIPGFCDMASFYQFLGGSAEQKQQQVFIRQMGGSGSIG